MTLSVWICSPGSWVWLTRVGLRGSGISPFCRPVGQSHPPASVMVVQCNSTMTGPVGLTANEVGRT